MSEWNYLDKWIAQIRYNAIKRYIPRGGGNC